MPYKVPPPGRKLVEEEGAGPPAEMFAYGGLPFQTFAVGNQVQCEFCFTNRALTVPEKVTFQAGGSLPVGVGVAPTAVLFDYKLNNGSTTTLTGGSITSAATGSYYAMLTLVQAGSWFYRGYGQDGSGNAVAATPTSVIAAVAF